MKTEQKAGAQKIGRRGRKSGDGVLKEIDPHGSALDVGLKLAYGRSAGDPIAEMVRTWLCLTKRQKELEALCQKIVVRLAGPPPTFQSLGIPPEHQEDPRAPQYLRQKENEWQADAFTKLAEVEARLKPFFRLSDGEAEKKLTDCNDAETFAYFKQRDSLHARLAEETRKLPSLWQAAFETDPERWFRKVADTVKNEIGAQAQDTYSLHGAVWRLAPLRPAKTVNGVPHYTTKSPVIPELPYTLPQICRLLDDAGHRPSGMTEEDWRRRVRTILTDLGLKQAKAQRRSGSSQKRLPPATLGLPANFGKPAFWRRCDLGHLLWEARTNYRRLLHRAHPDKGGDTETLLQAMQLWRNVQNAFKRHGYTLP